MSPVKVKHLHYKHGAYWYVRRAGGKVVWTRLSADLSEAMRLWSERERVSVPAASRSVAAALEKYLAHRTPDLQPATLRLYAVCRKRLDAAFVEFRDVAQVRAKHVRQYLDARTSKAAANREVSLLAAALGYVMQLGWIDSNPCTGVDHNPETPRRRCYTDAEIAALRDAASERMRCVIDLALLTAMRQGDLLALRLSDLTADGIVVEQRKTGARVVYQWTDALREVVDRAKRLRRRVGSLYLFAGDDGRQWRSKACAAAWERTRQKAGVSDAHFHDLRATAITWAKEAEGIDRAQALAGHASAKMTECYVARRAVTKVRPIR